MKYVVTFLALLLAPLADYAQVNLVRNGGFEQYAFCPYGVDQIGFANYWSGLDTNWNYADSNYSKFTSCLPEYCNTCDNNGHHYVGVPIGGWYYQYPRSGRGFAQVRILDNDTMTHDPVDERDFLQGRFSTALEPGRQYCVTFYASLSEHSAYAIQQLGAYFDNGAIDNTDSAHCDLPKPSIVPQVVSVDTLNDTLNWLKVQGSYIANGTERFITIGNFFDFNHTNKIPVVYTTFSYDGYTFYLIDDVSVITSDAVANAGADRHCSVGDSAWIGTNEQGMPCTWYLEEDMSHPIGYGGGLWVRPMATGSYHYVVMLDLCGHVTYDTMVLSVWPTAISGQQAIADNFLFYPNPAHHELTIEHAAGYLLSISNVFGQLVCQFRPTKDKESIDISNCPPGLYTLGFIDPFTGGRVVQKILVE